VFESKAHFKQFVLVACVDKQYKCTMSRFTSLLVLLLAYQVNSQVCTQCVQDGSFTLEPTRVLFPNAPKTCTDLTTDFTLLAAETLDADQECKDLQLYGFQIGCCAFPPTEYCSICPDGAAFESNNEVPLGTSDNPTCAEIQYRSATLNGVVEAGTCDDTFLRRGAHYCGCPNVEQQCFLCPNEGAPGAPRRGDAFVTNSDCLGIEYLFSVFTASECTTRASNLGVDLAAFCECPGSVVSEDNDCTLCQPGQRIPDRSLVYTESNAVFTRTCGQAADYAQYITQSVSCDALLAAPREACCAGTATTDGGGGSGAASLGVFASLMFASVMAIKSLVL
jgi:hypothetical protein